MELNARNRTVFLAMAPADARAVIFLTDTGAAVIYREASDCLRSPVIALSLLAAEAILSTYLGERTLPVSLRDAVVSEVKARLIQGTVPVLDRLLCEVIEDECIRTVPSRPGND